MTKLVKMAFFICVLHCVNQSNCNTKLDQINLAIFTKAARE